MPPSSASSSASFSNLRVAAFESRRAAEMARLIERNEGVALVSPSMREVAVEEDRPSIDFANRLITGQIDMVIFLTGVGLQHLIARIERHVDKQRFLDSLSDIKTVVRGPKPLAVLRELKIQPTLQIPPPNTWREILATLDTQLPVVNHTVGVQEYGVSNVSLIAGLEARGAKVESVSIYRWALPEDLGPLEENIRRLIAGEVDIALFTAAQQVVHLLQVAQRLELEQELRKALKRVVVGSIGPTTSETLREREIAVDFEPSHSKMGQLRAGTTVRRLGRSETIAGSTTPTRNNHDTNSRFKRGVARQRIHASLPARKSALHADLADASSRPVHGRIPRSPLAIDLSGAVQKSTPL